MKKIVRAKLGSLKRLLLPQQESRLVVTNETEKELKPKVHIGCGPINIQGWINIDARNAPHVHINTDVIDLKDFADNSVGEIYLCHVLEHFSFEEVVQVLNVFYKKLKPEGLLRISVPDFSLMAEGYINKKVPLKSLKFALMGGQDYQYNFHKSIYDSATLTEVLEAAGFKNCKEYNTLADFGVDLGDWSTGQIAEMPVSLNMKAYK